MAYPWARGGMLHRTNYRSTGAEVVCFRSSSNRPRVLFRLLRSEVASVRVGAAIERDRRDALQRLGCLGQRSQPSQQGHRTHEA
jgi:hypothetical protein